MKGTVKWYNRKKGYGFIAGEDGVDYFVHFSELSETRFIRTDDLVSFEPADTEKGKQAKSVVLEVKSSDRDDLQQGSHSPEAACESQEPESEGQDTGYSQDHSDDSHTTDEGYLESEATSESVQEEPSLADMDEKEESSEEPKEEPKEESEDSEDKK